MQIEGVIILSDSNDKKFFSNRELFDMFEDFKHEFSDFRNEFSKDLQSLQLQMRETTTLIRDYNGLRKEIKQYSNDVYDLKTKVAELSSSQNTKNQTSKDYIGWIFAGFMAVIAFLNYIN